MKLDFHTHKWIYFAVSALVVLFGLSFLFLPSECIGTFTVLMCVLLWIVGGLKIGLHYFMQNRIERCGWTEADGVIDVIVALLLTLLLTFPSHMRLLAPRLLAPRRLVGTWAMLCSIYLLRSAIAMRKTGDKKWLLFLALGILQIILYISMEYNSMWTELVETTAVGLFLIVHGITLFMQVVIE